jgi:hypothetical protein
MSAAVLRNKANPNTNFNKPTFDDVDNVMGLLGDFEPMRALAAKHGFVLVKVEDDVSASDMAVLEIVTKCWSTNGDFGKSVNEALADGKITVAEIELISEAAMANSQAMQQLLARLKGMSEK